jgi:mannose/fructose/N-acetylgalactosamine-specific phosphotransferase system component IIB
VKVLLYRVDDRLIHGQVVLGWGRRLGPDRLVVVDDRIAADPWERELLAAAAPPEVRAEFLTVAEASRALSGDGGPGAALVLLESPAAALALTRAGFSIPELNLGGLHREEGVQLTPYLFVTREDAGVLAELAAAGTRLYALDVPDGRRLAGEDLLRVLRSAFDGGGG